MKINRDKIPFLMFIFSISFFSYFYGFITAHNELPPYWRVMLTYNDIIDLNKHWKNELNIEPTRHLVQSNDRDREKAIVHDRDKLSKGYKLISGLIVRNNSLNGAILINNDGDEIHYWPIDYSAIDPDGPDIENVFLHGLEIYPDGSIIVNFDEGNVLAKLSACGNIIWKIVEKNKGFHHVVSKSYDGTIWSWQNNDLVNLNPQNGEILKRISLQEDVITKHDLQGIFALKSEENETELVYTSDPFHTNDVEVLSPDRADSFDEFSVGDLLISLRSLNLVAVLDSETYALKWWKIGPWHRQHDPDFLADGSISIYNNNMGFNYSEIVKIYPDSGEYRVLIRGSEKAPFYSYRRGKHEHLINGNILVTESERGRVFETDGNGKMLWEFHNIYDETRNGVVSKAIHIPDSFIEMTALECD